MSIVIPAFNEERRLPTSLESITDYLGQLGLEFWEIVVVDDGSRDGTATLVERWRERCPTVRLLRNPGNRGKGYAVRNGMLDARGDWILSTDADLSTPIAELKTLRDAALSAEADVAIGSRALDRSLVGVHQSPFREYSGRAFNGIMRLVTGLPFHDTQCGFKLFRSEAARAIFTRQQLDGFSFDVEDLYIARRLDLKVIEVPVRWNNVEGTKVSLVHGLRSFADLLLIRGLDASGRYRW